MHSATRTKGVDWQPGNRSVSPFPSHASPACPGVIVGATTFASFLSGEHLNGMLTGRGLATSQQESASDRPSRSEHTLISPAAAHDPTILVHCRIGIAPCPLFGSRVGSAQSHVPSRYNHFEEPRANRINACTEPTS